MTKKGRTANLQMTVEQATKKGRTANLQGMTVEQAARHMRVSPRMVYMARRAKRLAAQQGRQDVIDELVAGRLSVNGALKILEQKPKPTGYAKLVKAWNACTEDERAMFFAWVEKALNACPDDDDDEEAS